MKKLAIMIVAALCSLTASAQFDLGSLLKGLGNASTDSTETSQSGKGMGSLGSILGSVLGTSKVTPDMLVGTWKYSAPAVAFKSDNMLKKAGGAAAAATIEGKMAPYYKRAGLDKMTLTVAADSTFVMKLSRGSLKGSISQGDEGYLVFKFAVAGLNVGSYNAGVSIAGKQLTLTFDISKLMTIVDKISSITGNSTLKSANALLQSYDGMQAGFRMLKQ